MMDYREHLISSSSNIDSALVQLNNLGQDAILFVVDENDRLIGSLTDGDVRRGLIKGISIHQKVIDIIQPNPRSIKKDCYNIYEVISLRQDNLRVIPVLNESHKIIKIINFRKLRSYLPVDAVIMAGGRGQRLSPLTDSLPKPLLKVGDFPIIEHNLKRLCLFGIDDFWISVRYLGKKIEDHFGNGQSRDINIRYIWEDEPLGTIGALSTINDFKHPYILVTNSDLLTNLDYEHFFLEFLQSEADLGIVTIPYHVNIPYAVLETRDGKVLDFKEKPTYTYYSNGGIYLFKREVFDLLPRNSYADATDLMETLISKGKNVFSYPLNGYWLDIGSPEDYKKAQFDINHIKF